MDTENLKTDIEDFINNECKSVITPIINLNNEVNNEILNDNTFNNNVERNLFDTIDLSFIDDDSKENDEDTSTVPLYDKQIDIAINEIFRPDQENDFDEPDTLLQSRMLTPLPPEVDINAYQHKKTLAQGMMDLALLLANANQLRYVLESKSIHPYYMPNIILLGISISLQISVGIALILNTQFNVKNEREMVLANRINNFTLIGVFLITIVNVFISAFGIADTTNS